MAVAVTLNEVEASIRGGGRRFGASVSPRRRFAIGRTTMWRLISCILLSSFFFLFSTILFSFSLIYLVFILRDHNLKSRTAQHCQVFMGFQWGQNVFLKKKQKRIHHVFIRFFFVSMITLKKTNKQKKRTLLRPSSDFQDGAGRAWNVEKKNAVRGKKNGERDYLQRFHLMDRISISSSRFSRPFPTIP